MTTVEARPARRREWWVLLAIALAGALVAGSIGLILRHPGRGTSGPPAAAVAVDSTVESGHPGPSPTGSGTVPATTTPTGIIPTDTSTDTRAAGSGSGQPTATGPTTTATTSSSPPPPPPPPPPQMVTVPDVMNYAEKPAVDAIRAAGLNPIVDRQETLNQCYVIQESPQGDTQAVVGQNVYITVATNTGPCEGT